MWIFNVDDLYLKFAYVRSVKVVNACLQYGYVCCVCVCDEHVDDVSRHRYIDFLVAMISVGLASARPNNIICLKT